MAHNNILASSNLEKAPNAIESVPDIIDCIVQVQELAIFWRKPMGDKALNHARIISVVGHKRANAEKGSACRFSGVHSLLGKVHIGKISGAMAFSKLIPYRSENEPPSLC